MKEKRKAAAVALCAVLTAAGAACAFLPCAACAAELSRGGAAAVWEADGSAAAEALRLRLPMTMTFQREGALFVSRSSVGALPGGAEVRSVSAGDLLYLPEDGRLAVALRPGAAPEGSVRVGHMPPGRWMDAGQAELAISSR